MILKIIKPSDKEAVKDYIDKLPDKRYTIEIKQKREQRSISQNALYWLWMACIMNETGNDKIDLHKFFTEKYLPVSFHLVFGKQIERSVSTTSLDTIQFTHYLERIQQFASSELGIILPKPEDLQWAKFYEQYKNFI